MNTSNQHTQSQFDRENAYLRAEKRIKMLKGFYWHLFWYLVINIFLLVMLAINVKNFDLWRAENFSTAFFWGIGLGFHALGVFGGNLLFSKDWEARVIQKYQDKENKRWE
ncbi:2TM domain-containing protein [Siansivirga zeaxanthinifaciens]|uniref:2TM domain-containing protein n=1 Tax=Siansivirga zeaxanthinifaciens CC-SAMT-1 TaxID=1454006 RepID=A0A0C5WLU3_9FLAO|nr:2TM domain-containing protein [Siansivirga zeaxanthinifaciens]AJR03770.1 hypothetical protein AW14_09230 [Siansivirga zeaxanthinifaciens CC-SAMT-1]